MEPPRKPDFESPEDRAGATAKVYDPDGLQRDVSLEEADAWWEVELPNLYRDWQEEKAAAGRWERAVDLVREWLAQERLESFVLTDDGHTEAVPAKMWLTGEADRAFFVGTTKVARMGTMDVYTYEGRIVLRQDEVERLILAKLDSPRVDAVETEPVVDPIRFPYMAFLIRAAREGPFAPSGRTPKKVIEGWLRDNWRPELGKLTDTKVENMATFLRRPDDEKGGITTQDPDHKSK